MTKIRFKRTNNVVPDEDVQVGDIVFVKESDDSLRQYNVLKDGNHHLVKGIDKSQEAKLDGLDTQIEIDGKISASKNQAIAEVKQEVYLKSETYNKQEVYLKEETYNQQQVDSKVDTAVSQAQGTPIEITGTVLPQGTSVPAYITNVGTADLFGGDADAKTYTQTGGSSIVVNAGKYRKGYFNRSTNLWTAGEELTLGKVDVVDGFDSTSKDKAGSSDNDRVLKEEIDSIQKSQNDIVKHIEVSFPVGQSWITTVDVNYWGGVESVRRVEFNDTRFIESLSISSSLVLGKTFYSVVELYSESDSVITFQLFNATNSEYLVNQEKMLKKGLNVIFISYNATSVSSDNIKILLGKSNVNVYIKSFRYFNAQNLTSVTFSKTLKEIDVNHNSLISSLNKSQNDIIKHIEVTPTLLNKTTVNFWGQNESVYVFNNVGASNNATPIIANFVIGKSFFVVLELYSNVEVKGFRLELYNPSTTSYFLTTRHDLIKGINTIYLEYTPTVDFNGNATIIIGKVPFTGYLRSLRYFNSENITKVTASETIKELSYKTDLVNSGYRWQDYVTMASSEVVTITTTVFPTNISLNKLPIDTNLRIKFKAQYTGRFALYAVGGGNTSVIIADISNTDFTTERLIEFKIPKTDSPYERLELRTFVATTVDYAIIQKYFIFNSDDRLNPLKGQNVSYYGDSITAINNRSDGVDPVFPVKQYADKWGTMVAWWYEFGRFFSRGIGGSMYSWGTGGGSVTFIRPNGTLYSRNDSFNYDNFNGVVPEGTVKSRACFCSWKRITDMYPESIKNDVDIIIIKGSSNDSLDSTDPVFVPNSTIDKEWQESSYYTTYGGDYNIDSLKGGIASTIMKMQAWMPNAVIVLATPLSGRYSVVGGINTTLKNDEFTKSIYVREIANAMSIPLIDINATCGVNGLNRTTYITDVVHPYNVEGNKALARSVISGLKLITPKL